MKAITQTLKGNSKKENFCILGMVLPLTITVAYGISAALFHTAVYVSQVML